MKKQIFIILFLIFVFGNGMFIQCAEQEKENLSEQKQAELCIKNSESVLVEFIENGFEFQRINDSLKKAKDLYSAQIILLNSKKNSDFSNVLFYCNEIEKVRQLAFQAKDELASVKKFYFEVGNITEEMILLSAEINIIEEEIKNERYEKVIESSSNLYKKITEIQASATAINLFYKATSRGLKNFIRDNYLKIFVFILVFFVSFKILKKPIKRKIIQRKINALEIEKDVLKKLMQQSQKDYFQEGKISEGIYNLKIKKFSELVRDIDRQLPLLREEILKITKFKKKDEQRSTPRKSKKKN